MAKRAFDVPADLKYTKDHEWIRIEASRARIGITDFAQDALTDVVYAELPEVGDEVKRGDSMGVVESTKSVSDVFAPLTGKVVEINERLDDEPELLNTKPYTDGWFCVVELSAPAEVSDLLDAANYRKVSEAGH
ncbi:MAG TPA: glycine cleavage system protein GcvH [Candidatus Thermoplasmatota archaeon]|nr:glycine cleavage system protein GcvH [Candidatus Thermoplasmatota archaeon]